MEIGSMEERFCCDECAKNIESFKARFCSNKNKDVHCRPIVWDRDQLSNEYLDDQRCLDSRKNELYKKNRYGIHMK